MTEPLIDRMAKALQWFIDEDETNRGDIPMPEYGGRTWNELNEYWIKGADNAIALLEEYQNSKK